MIDEIQKQLIEEVADLHTMPEGAYNIRANSKMAARNTTANIDIISKEDKSGIDIHIKPGTKNESVHIPVVLSESGIKETVYNDFYIGDDADVTIVAGCGIHNCGNQDSEHDGIHRFFVGKNAKIRYVEKHYGEGDGKGKRILNPVTEVYQEEGSYVDMEMVQIKGVDSTVRVTKAVLKIDGDEIPLGWESFKFDGTDVILNDRKKDFYISNITLCEENCEYEEFNIETSKAKCNCNVKKEIKSEPYKVIFSQNKIIENF